MASMRESTDLNTPRCRRRLVSSENIRADVSGWCWAFFSHCRDGDRCLARVREGIRGLGRGRSDGSGLMSGRVERPVAVLAAAFGVLR